MKKCLVGAKDLLNRICLRRIRSGKLDSDTWSEIYWNSDVAMDIKVVHPYHKLPWKSFNLIEQLSHKLFENLSIYRLSGCFDDGWKRLRSTGYSIQSLLRRMQNLEGRLTFGTPSIMLRSP